MLMINNLSGFGASGSSAIPLTSTFLQATSDSTDQTTYTFSSVNIGAADATRRVVVAFHWSVQNAARTAVSLSIAGVASDLHVQTTTGPTSAQQDCGVLLFSSLVPTGTSGNIVVTMSGAMGRATIYTYRQIGGTGTSAFATMTDNVISGTTLTGTLNIPTDGTLYAAATSQILSGNTTTWTGITEEYDAPHAEAAGILQSGGHTSSLTVETGRTVSSVTNGTSARGSLVAMSWA